MRAAVSVHIPQPCAESWDAMLPTGPGRHCAACQKTVVDFTEKTDAEILAYLAQAMGDTCGRFGNDQLNRPLLPALVARPASRWHAWLALAFAMWGLRAGPAAAGARWAGPSSTVHPPKKTGTKPITVASKLLRGTVRDAATHEPLAGAAIFLKGENRSAVTDVNGRFSLRLPPTRRTTHTLVLHFTGYQSQAVRVLASAGQALPLELLVAPVAGAEIVGYIPTRQERQVSYGAPVVLDVRPAAAPLPPARSAAPPPPSFWHRLTHPFRR